MKIFHTLLWLQWRLFINQFRGSLLSTLNISRSLIIALYTLLSLALGFSISLVLHILQRELGAGWVNNANNFFLTILAVVIFAKTISSGRLLKQMNSRTLHYYPIRESVLTFFQFTIGLIDLWYLGFACCLLGFLGGIGSLTISIEITFVVLFLLVANVVILHLLVEILEAMVQWLFMLPRLVQYILLFIVVALAFTLVHPLFFQDFSLRAIIDYIPVSSMNKALYGLVFQHKDLLIFQTAVEFLIMILAGLALILMLGMIQKGITSERVESKASKKEKSQLERISVVFPILGKLAPFVLKDLLYMLRSKRTRMMLVVELLWFLIVFSMFVRDQKTSENIYIFLHFLSFFPVVFWDLHLSNSFGMERLAFSIYLISPVSPERVLLGKNISFVLMRIPSIIITWLLFGFYFSFSLLPLLILCQTIVLCSFIAFGNFNSVRLPYPVERNERLFLSTTGTFSPVGFAGLLVSFVLPILVGFLLWKLGATFVTYAIVGSMTFATMIIFWKTLGLASRIFMERGELIYQTLRQS